MKTRPKYFKCLSSEFEHLPVPTDREEWIRDRAYQLWVLSRCEYGHDLEHWLEAEAEFSSAYAEEE